MSKIESPPGAKTPCNDKKCPFHGGLSLRGKKREGIVVSKKMTGTCTVMIHYLQYVPKFKRYERRRSKIHAHIPQCIDHLIKEGDTVIIYECRRLAKTVAHVVVGKKEEMR